MTLEKRLALHLAILKFNMRWFKNWPELYLNRLLGKSAATLKMRNGIAFRTPNIYETIPIIKEIFEDEVYGDLKDLPPNPLIIDVGGYVGTFALYALWKRPDARIISCEPEPSNFGHLQANTREFKNIESIEVAIGGESGICTLYVQGEGKGTNTTVPELANQQQAPIQVNCLTLEGLMRQKNLLKCDLLKLDCEGTEKEIYENLPPGIGKVMIEWSAKYPRPTELPAPTTFVGKGHGWL